MALSSYNSKKQSLAPNVEPLIKHLTGFKEDDKHFQEVAKFTYSNLIHHNFPSVNSTAVKKSINGIIEKLKVHGMSSRAKRLEELVNTYDDMTNSTTHAQMDLQWNVLLFLLKLSYKPTSVTDEELGAKNVQLEPESADDNINWAEYLKEGLEDVPSNFYDNESDEEEAWSSLSEEEKEGEEALEGYGGIPHPSLWRPPPSAATSLHRVLRTAVRSEQWLRDNVQYGWWLGMDPPSPHPPSRHPVANFCRLWEASVNTPEAEPALVTTEYRLLKEVVWLLFEPGEAVFFKRHADGRFYVRPNISLASTIPASLHSTLSEMCPYLDMVRKLRDFEEDLYRLPREAPAPNTLKAYCSALRRQMKPFCDAVLGIETRLNSQEETMTVVSVWHELGGQLERLSCLSDIHDHATDGWQDRPNWIAATRLLSVLFECLVECGGGEWQTRLCLDLFLSSFSVYLHIIDVWLSHGRLDDWPNEFLVLRDEEGGGVRVMPYERAMRESGVRPVWLVARLVAVAGDAQRTLATLARLGQLPQLSTLATHQGSLVKEFTENIYNEVKRLNGYMEPDIVQVEGEGEGKELTSASSIAPSIPQAQSSQDLPEKTTERLGGGEGEGGEVPPFFKPISSQAMFNQMMEDACRDSPLIGEALRPFLTDTPSPTTPTPTPYPSHSLLSEHNHSVGLVSIYRVLERQLELVEGRHGVAERLVTRALLAPPHHLMRHFTLLRSVFFMESGILAQRFYSYLFNEISCGTWANGMNLSVQLQTCVEEEHPGLGHLFTVLVNRTTTPPTTTKVHKAISCIALAYTPDWPISLLITQDTVDSYNVVFRFLLHLKYAFWTLRNMSFSDLAGSENALRVRHLNMLKLWMYHSTNTLHTYFMGLVLRRFSALMDHSIQQAHSLDDIIKAHVKFLKEVKMHCLQDGDQSQSQSQYADQKPKKKNMLEVFIMKLVLLCGELAGQWQREAAGQLGDGDVVQLRDRYLLAYRGLLHCLQALHLQPDTTNHLDELRSEIVHSVPTAWDDI